MSRPVAIIALDNTLVRVGKRGPVKLKAAHVMNIAAAATFVQFFDAADAADITLGTTVPDYVLGAAIASPSNQADLVDLLFGKGLFVAATTTAGGLTAPSVGVPASFSFDD